jgi:acyl-coenzyme A thioesterase PaaI-like protein
MTDPHHPPIAGCAPSGTPDRDEAATVRNDALLAMMPFALDLGIELETAGPGTTVTTSSTTQLLRAVRGGAIRAVSTPLHVGRSQATIVTDLLDDDGRLVARTTQSQSFLHQTDSADRQPGSKADGA